MSQIAEAIPANIEQFFSYFDVKQEQEPTTPEPRVWTNGCPRGPQAGFPMYARPGCTMYVRPECSMNARPECPMYTRSGCPRRFGPRPYNCPQGSQFPQCPARPQAPAKPQAPTPPQASMPPQSAKYGVSEERIAECLGHLKEMGFPDEAKNRAFVIKFEGSMNQIIEALTDDSGRFEYFA